MERLTNKKEADTQRQEYENRLKNGYPRTIPEERFLKLAAYEDTGLEPGEVVAMKIVLLGRELAKITDVDGVSINRICELAQAEKDGQLMILPPNDPLTLEELREMIGRMVQCGSVDGQFFGRMLVGMNGCVICNSFDFADYGKTWLAYRRKPEEVDTCQKPSSLSG